MRSFDSIYFTFLMKNKEHMPNDLNGYKDLIGNIKLYVEQCYNDYPGYKYLMDIINNIEIELGKYDYFL